MQRAAFFLVCGIGIAGFFQRNGAEGFLHTADVVQIAIISHDSAAAVKDYTSVIKTKSNTVTGTYYLYDGINVKGRYRITKPASRCGKKPIGKNVTGWIDAKYVT